MKKIIFTLTAALTLFIGTPTITRAQEASMSTMPMAITEYDEEELRDMIKLDRLEEIKQMDKSELSFSEKRALKREANAIRNELNIPSNGVYVAGGGMGIFMLVLVALI